MILTPSMIVVYASLIFVVTAVSKPSKLILISKFGAITNVLNNRKRLWDGTSIHVPRGGEIADSIDNKESHGGGIDASAVLGSDETDSTKELTLDEKVYAAMKKLGLEPPPATANTAHEDINIDTALSEVLIAESSVKVSNSSDNLIKENVVNSLDSIDSETGNNCPDGVCEMPTDASSDAIVNIDQSNVSSDETVPENDPNLLAETISKKMNVDLSMAWAALGATSIVKETNKRIYSSQAACEMIQNELNMISKIHEDSDDVKLLVSEGYSSFFVRRALAFTDRNVDDARAILLADKMDEEDEETAAADVAAHAEATARIKERKQLESSFKTVNVDAGFDPTKLSATSEQKSEPSLPTPASREAVIFEATAAQLQELVLESPVPVLLDIYADWCGPCKALSPILEDMAMKSGGTLRLVKVNSDNERAVSQALEVTALPTIFGIRDGKIRHMFQGMPKSEEMMKNFLMGLMIPGQSFSPPITEVQTQKYSELSNKLMKVAVTASFPFAARERLHDRINAQIDNLVQQTGNVFDAEQALVTIRSLITNIIRDPYEVKYRTINLSNKVIAAKVAKYQACLVMLKSVGFGKVDSTMTIGKNKPFVNTAPLTVMRDTIDKWVDRTRYEVAREARKRRDEEDRISIQAQLAVAKELHLEKSSDEGIEEVDPDACILKFRIDGKKKVHEISLHADDSLKRVLEYLPEGNETVDDDGGVLITCVAKRLVVKSTDHNAMNKSLRDHGLIPMANIVIKFPLPSLVTTEDGTKRTTSSSLANRAASKKKLKKGSHTMQSIGVYSTQDNAKGELIDGGGGTWYEHDVSEDDDESTTTSEFNATQIKSNNTDNADQDDKLGDEDGEISDNNQQLE